MADLGRMDEGARRAAETALRAGGGRSVLLRRPRPGATNDVTEQLGLATATFDDAELGPATLRQMTGSTRGGTQLYELLVSARAVAAVSGIDETAAALAVLESAAGILVDGMLLRIMSVSYRDLSGVPYLYRMELAMPEQPVVV